ncbi:hypothetical protein DTO271G3_7909 [Paecilomyces variotii]|nr:hypothetical protein DTO271G3_7909 [Paecilomyces variotii]
MVVPTERTTRLGPADVSPIRAEVSLSVVRASTHTNFRPPDFGETSAVKVVNDFALDNQPSTFRSFKS